MAGMDAIKPTLGRPFCREKAIGKTVLFISILLLLISIGIAVTETVTTFYGEDATVNVSLDGVNNETLYLRVRNAYARNITITVEDLV